MGNLTGFAKNLKSIRERRQLKQTDIAEKIGVTPQTISAYEKGGGEKGKNPTLERVIDIADVLDVSLDELCGRSCKLGSRTKTLGDVAQLICNMWDWDTVTFSEQDVIRHLSDIDTAVDSCPSIIFEWGSLRKFLEDYSKLRKLRDECTIDDRMFNDWTELKIRELDSENIESQKDYGELPF